MMEPINKRILRLLLTNGPSTAVDLWKEHFAPRHLASVCARFTELGKGGLVQKVGRIKSKYSGRKAWLWEALQK